MNKLVFSVLLVFAGVAHAQSAPVATEPSATPTPEAKVLEKAKSIEMYCTDKDQMTVEKFSFSFRYDYDKTGPLQTITYYIAQCMAGAYNGASVLFHDDQYNGLEIVPLSSPYTNKKNKVAGWKSSIVNGFLSYDEKTHTLTDFTKGRGVGDAFSSATYSLYQNDVILRKYDYDGTYDGKINPKTIFESKESMN